MTRPGRFDQVGCIIDPNQHTAMVMGWVDNADGRLRVGQFVTVHLQVPPPKSEVVIPAAALCEEGGRTTVFLHPEGTQEYVRRQVIVSRRSGDKVYLRSQVTRRGAAARVGAALAGPTRGHVANRAVDGKLERIEIREANPGRDKPVAPSGARKRSVTDQRTRPRTVADDCRHLFLSDLKLNLL